MTDYQIMHVLGALPSPQAQEKARQRRDSRPPVSADPRQAFADLMVQGGRCTREQALAEYDRHFGKEG